MAIRFESLAHQTALVGIFAAFHVVVTIMPFSVALGTTANISMGIISAPIIGFLLGPYLGTIAVLIGSLLGITMNTSVAVMGPFTPIATASGAFAAGALTTDREKWVLPLFLVGIIAFVLSPVGLTALAFLWLHIIALAMLSIYLVPRVSAMIKGAIETPSSFLQLLGAVGFVAFLATMTNHIVGSSIAVFYFIYVLHAPVNVMSDVFFVLAFVYPIERAVATIIITLVTASVLRAIQSGSILTTSKERRTETPKFMALDFEP